MQRPGEYYIRIGYIGTSGKHAAAQAAFNVESLQRSGSVNVAREIIRILDALEDCLAKEQDLETVMKHWHPNLNPSINWKELRDRAVEKRQGNPREFRGKVYATVIDKMVAEAQHKLETELNMAVQNNLFDIRLGFHQSRRKLNV